MEWERVMEDDEKQSLHAKARKKEKEQVKKEGDAYEWRVLEKDKVRKNKRGQRDWQSENSSKIGMREKRKRPQPELQLKVKKNKK